MFQWILQCGGDAVQRTDAVPDLLANETGHPIGGYKIGNKQLFWQALQKKIDQMAGAEGFLDDLMDSVRFDPNGPKVDIPKAFDELMGTNIWHLSTDDNDLWIWSIKQDAMKSVNATCLKMMQFDPNAKQLPDGIWQVDDSDPNDQNAKKIKLYWAVAKGHLMHASDLPLLRKVIAAAK